MRLEGKNGEKVNIDFTFVQEPGWSEETPPNIAPDLRRRVSTTFIIPCVYNKMQQK